MAFRAYEFDTNTGKLGKILEFPVPSPATAVPPLEKVLFLSQKAFNVDWTGPGMSGSAKSEHTDIELLGKTYKSGWFAICREAVTGQDRVKFTVSSGTRSDKVDVEFAGLAGWTPKQNQVLGGRIIVRKPGLTPPLPIDIQSFALGALTGIAVAAAAVFAWYNFAPIQ